MWLTAAAPIYKSNPLNAILYGIIIAAVVICVLIVKRTKPAENKVQLPIRTVEATLIQKKIAPKLSNQVPVTSSVIFRTQTGEWIEFHINWEFDLEWYNEGDRGNLTYQGGRILKFERTHNAALDETPDVFDND